ncbi:nitric oxide reductase transcriptional regulator NorR [Vibrio panuliri]|uniref:Nitric oxide reductase transcription regulator n=1 Tax=Vibrio panuliri TaxID=1381081 RepID=A0A1Q9HJ69_9VIBR|nr:nitric oxide reductase transcriptional regulator NorR [Vibrio panuliri]KAB1454077.1 nitric oxide reductase transcriptional regulator NorR [Vibrio panuliri]OLQ88656.1 nitric oxide reductase transcription regulator [Vibrio panuliri]OLQ90388.1 nitric oxide reductase transcription regulator [Vibrio panuliri]
MTVNVEQTLLDIALNLSTSLASEEQYQHIVEGISQVFPCDAAALFILDEQGFLTPVAVKGVSHSILGRRFFPSAHPRLQQIMQSRSPVRFDANCPLPDPFDGVMLTADQTIDVHDCLGCSLYVEGQLVGVLTMDALNVGAFDDLDTMMVDTFTALTAATLRNIAQLKALKAQNRKHRSVTQTLIQQARTQQGEMVGFSPQFEKLKQNIATVAKSDFAVLVSGETGTGKELVAHNLHAQSHRADKPMIYVNCAALPEGLAESELFGHVKGAFTGANSHRSGKFELADGGTIFLDEIGELPLILQAKLLRVIQQGELQRVGSDQHLTVNVRIIAATNRKLEEEVEQGRFRADLFHRLNVFPIYVPPLREREGDIAVLSGYLLEKMRTQFNAPNLHVHPKALQVLESQDWQGNIRQLEHSLTRAALHAIQHEQMTIQLHHFDDIKPSDDVKNTSRYFPLDSQPMRTLVELYQKDLITHALECSNKTWAQAADFLQMDRGNLYRMGKKLGIQ